MKNQMTAFKGFAWACYVVGFSVVLGSWIFPIGWYGWLGWIIAMVGWAVLNFAGRGSSPTS